MSSEKLFLGVEFGSTKIKAVAIDEGFAPASSGEFTWKSSLENGVWTYKMEDAISGLKTALLAVEGKENIKAMGISGMMHGYLAFDEEWNLLAPFRTWQNTITAEAAEKLTALFGFNIPQRWSIAHLYQAVLNKEEHISRVAHITTLAGYMHFLLTGENAVGVGEASGMFPIDSETIDYDEKMLEKFDALGCGLPKLRALLPKVLKAGESAGRLTEKGAALIDNMLPAGVPFAPPEGDAGTGMTATNAVAPRTGNVSAGTSIFSMVVLEDPLKNVHSEIDVVTTPTGKPVAMVHCNNCTNDMNAWVKVLAEAVELFYTDDDYGEKIYRKIYLKSLEGDADCGGVTVYNYLAGEGVTHLDEGRPMVVRQPGGNFTLANFSRAMLYSTMSTLKIGMDILADEGVKIDRLMGHGGVFKTPGVGQRYMAAACKANVTCMETAAQGGPYGMAVLAAFGEMKESGETLESFLDNKVFKGCKSVTLEPDPADVAGFEAYIARFKAGLAAEKTAAENMK